MLSAAAFFVGGLALLLASGDFLTRATLVVATRVGISPLAAALTITALATSMPEAVVCLIAAYEGAPDIALGNVVGSNIANIFLVLGLPAIFMPIACTMPTVRRNAVFGALAVMLFAALLWRGGLGWGMGIVFLCLCAAYLAYALFIARRRMAAGRMAPRTEAMPGLANALALAGGASLGLYFGASLTIRGAQGLAEVFAIPQTAIALSLIAVGTSLPELATSLAAALRKRTDILIGNVLGSNILNVLGIIGLTALVVPLDAPAVLLRFDLWAMLAAGGIILLPVFARAAIGRFAGICFVSAYAAYIYGVFALHAGA